MKAALKHIILFFILLYSCMAYAQNAWLDSVKKVITKQKADTNKINSLINLSEAYRFSYPDSALMYAQQALAIAEKLHDDNATFWSITAVSGALYVLGNYTLELDYALKMRALSKKLNTPYTTGYANGMLSDCYYNLGEYDTSLKYWRAVIKISQEKLPGELFSIYGNASHIFAHMHEDDSALIYAKKSFELIKHDPLFNKENNNNSWAKSHIYTLLGSAFAGKANYDSALFYYKMSIPFSDNIQMLLNKVDAYNGMAKVYEAKSNPDSAIWYAKKALDEKIIKTYPMGMLKATDLLAALYESKNNADSSLKYLRITLNIKDSLFNREKTMAFQNILFKEQEKRKDIEAATEKLKRQYTAYLLIALLIISLIIAGVVIRTIRIKQLQKIRNRIADDLHDDIGSALSSISIMSELAKSKSPEALQLLTSIGESTTTVQENMSDIVWTIKAGNDHFENVLQRMNRFASEILDSKNIELDFKSDTSLAASKLTMEQRKNLYLFFKEIINNAAKHSYAKKVSVRIAQKHHHIEVNIRDDGNGFDTKNEFAGNGMSSLKKRAAELKAKFDIMSCINEGTEVNLKFKIT